MPTLEATFKLTDQYSANMQKIIKATDNFDSKQKEAQKGVERLKSSFKSTQNSTSSAATGIDALTSKVTKFVTASYLGKKAIDVMFSAIKTGAEKQVQLNTFQSLLNSDEAGKALYDYIQIYGKQKSILGDMGVANATKSFLPFTQDINQLQKMYQLTERLYARDPTQGSGGAVFAMKELISGDVMSARERFNISGISGAKIRDLANSGDINGTLQYLDDVFNRFGATQAIVDKNFTSLQTQATKFGNSVRSALGDESSPAVQNLSTMFQQLNADMDAGKFAPFFNLVGNGLYYLGSGLSWLSQNLSTVVPVIGGLSMALLAYKTVSVIATAATSAMNITLSAATGNWIALAAGIAGAVTAYGIYKNMDSIAGSAGSGAAKSAEDAQKAAEQAIAKAQKLSGSGALNTEITNKAPIPVKGTVEIEKESLRYQFDLAAQKAMAMFNLQQVTPQVNVHVERVEKTADMEEVANYLGDVVYQNQQTQAAGVYA